MMSDLFKKNKVFWIAYLVFWLIGIWLLSRFKKGDIEKYINQHYTSDTADIFFKYFTWVGDGLFYILVGLVLLYFHRQRGWVALVSFAVVGICVQLLKNFVFTDAPRPLSFFGAESGLHLVEGISIHKFGSFPSGHSATAFSVFFLLAFYSKYSYIKFLCLICAVLAAFSRVYLLQHFFVDVYFGSIIGLILTISVDLWITKVGFLSPSSSRGIKK
ncbi:MAG: phosphatase PAP2 family protein [Microscillaceae bacterium]|nr:phosphatase PAP2 family protein [Microscillaceae bacterium]